LRNALRLAEARRPAGTVTGEGGPPDAE